MHDISLKVTQLIIEKLGVPESEITNDASFIEDFGVDSLDRIELLMEVEKEFEIDIPDDEMEKITTVGILITYVTKQKGY